MNFRELLDSTDPLEDGIFEAVLTSREETTLVDFKLDFLPTEEREWLENTKDAMAFANTFGGYLAFGVRDRASNSRAKNSAIPLEIDKNQSDCQGKTNNHEYGLGSKAIPKITLAAPFLM